MDFEDIVAEDMARGGKGQKLPKSALAVIEAIYSASPGLEKIAYKHGFSLGKSIFAKSNGAINALFSVLENGGLENILHYPFNDSVVITASSRRQAMIGRKVHIYESGLIAGYLTSATGTHIYVEEAECEYNGDSRCKFVSSPSVGALEMHVGNRDLDGIVSDVSEMANVGGRVSAGYYAAAILPVANRTSSETLANLFYIAGSRLAVGNADVGLGKIAGIAGASSIEIAKEYRHVPKLVRLKYAPASSIGPFVDAAANAVAGFIEHRYGYEPKARRRLLRDKGYLVELSAK